MKESSLFIQLSSVQSLVVSDSSWPHGLQHARPPSVQSSHSVVSDSLRPHKSQHARPPCPSHLPEFTQTHAHWVHDAIQPSHPPLSPSPPPPSPSQHQSLFQWVNSSHEVAQVLEFQLQRHSLQRNPRADLQPSTNFPINSRNSG